MTQANKPIDLLTKYYESEDGCWVYEGRLDSHGYGQMTVAGKAHLVHRLSWVIHNGPIPENMFVCHKCDYKPCINPEHLFLGTHQDNMTDMVSKDRQALHQGMDNGRCSISELTARSIKANLDKSNQQLSSEYNVPISIVRNIRSGAAWRWL